MRFLFCLLTLCVLLTPATTCFAQDSVVQLEADSISKDYAGELPRIPPTEPADSLAKFQLHSDFRIELAAQEPLVSDPIAMAFDERGRLFVVCMRGYSENPDDNLGVVRMLEDTDADGVFDQGVDFAKGLSWPTAIACYDGGVLVASAPDLLLFKDTDDDGTADDKQLIASGFGRQNVQGMINSFRWGLDNRLYGASGTNGGEVVQPDDQSTPQTRTARTQSLRGRDFSMDPATLQLRPESGGAQHGATFDRWGDRFVCSNSDHVQWVEFEDTHLQRNSQLRGYPSRRSIAAEGPAAEVFRTSAVEPWRIVRTRLRVKGMVRGPVEGGGRAAGYFTSASGVTSLLGDAFPQKFQQDDYIVVGDVGSNLVHLKRVDSQRLNKTAKRATADGTEFLTSTDNWFRPVQFANGPDGTLYVLDMYREVIEHPLSLPPMIKRHLDLNSGRSRGRIYRIAPRQWKPQPRPLPTDANPAELVAMLGHNNGWHRETAARLIVWQSRTPAKIAEQYGQELSRATPSLSPLGRIRSLYCLHTIGKLTEPTLVRQLQDDHPQVRRHALKVAESANHVGEATLSQLRRMVDDPDIAVRYQLALCLGRFDWQDRRDPLVQLALTTGDERKLRFAVLSSMGEQRVEMLAAVLDKHPSHPPIQLLEEIAAQMGRNRSRCGAGLLTVASQPPKLRERLTASMLAGTGLRSDSLIDLLETQNVPEPTLLLNSIVTGAQRSSLDPANSTGDRLRAIQLISLGKFHAVRKTLEALLQPRQSAEIRDAAVDATGRFTDPDAAELLLTAARSLPPAARRRAYDLLVSQRVWANRLAQAIVDGDIDANQISAVHRERLLRQPLSDEAREAVGKSTDRAEVVATFQQVLDGSGSASRGRALFQKVCATCHRLDEFGTNVGPDLAPLRNRGAAYLLTNILDPNREVDPRYEAYTIVTTDGRTISGLLVSDTAAAATLQQPDNKRTTIAKHDIEILQATGRSLMPEGLERDLGKQGLADVVAYLVEQAQF